MIHSGTTHFYDMSRLEPLLSDGQVILTPNFRLARRIKAEWDALQQGQGLVVWKPVAVYPLESYLQQKWREAVQRQELPHKRLLDTLQVKELWTQVIEADCAEQGEFSLLQSGAAAELAQQARDMLLRADVDTSAVAVLSEFSLDSDCASFHRWRLGFEARLEALEAATLSDLVRELCSNALERSNERVVLLDFDDIPPLYLKCLQSITASQEEVSGGRGDARLQVVSYGDRQAEIDALASWAASSHAQNPDATLGILLADMQADRASLEYALRREFDCLGENYTALPVNFSTGISLDQAPVVRDALRVLAAAGKEVPLADVVGLLHSRFIASPDIQSDQLVKLLQQLYRDGSATIDSGRLRYLAQKVKVGEVQGMAVGEALKETSSLQLRHQQALPSSWAEHFNAILSLWQWPGDQPLDSLEYQQVEAWFALLEEFAGFDGVSGELDLNGALGLLRRCCQGKVSQPQTADSAIQVLGPLEGAGLHFDKMWFCGLQGSRWPAPARPNPFLPLSLQRKYQMPHSSSEREWLYASGLMTQYRSACEELYISFSRQLDGAPEIPSPLIAEEEVVHVESTPDVSQAWLSRQAQAQIVLTDDIHAPPVTTQELDVISGGSSILQNQAACSFRAFVRHRLAVEPLGDFGEGLTAADRGSLLHDSLFVLWGEIECSDTLGKMDSAAREAAVSRAIRTAIEDMSASTRQLVGMPCLEVEQQRLQILLLQWLELESERSSFKVSEREQPIEINLAGLPLRLRVDRVDTVDDKANLVIDYKSGRCQLSDWMGSRMSQPQLPLYGIAKQVDGLAFAQMRPRDSKFIGLGKFDGIPGVKTDIEKSLARSASNAATWEELQDEWRRDLEALAARFLAGESQVDPQPGACDYCGLQALCRIEFPGEAQQ